MENDISYKQYQSIDFIDKNLWNSLVPLGNITGSWQFIKTLEESFKDEINFYYFVFTQNNVVVAVAMAHIMTLSVSKLSPIAIRRYVKLFGRLQRFNFLICGNIVADAMNTLYCLDDTIYPLILGTLDDLLLDIVKKKNLKGILYKEFNEEKKELFMPLKERGYAEVRSLPYHYMNIKWENIEEYIKSLKSKVRWSFNQSRKKFKENGLYFEITNDINIVTPDLYNLYMFVHQKAQFQLETVSIDFFKLTLGNLEGKCKLLLLKKDGQIIGFDIFFEDESCIQWLYVGYNGEMNTKYDIYFNLSFGLLEEAIALKKKYFNVGQTGDSFKSRMGCNQKDKYFFLQLQNPVTHMIVSKLSKSIFKYPEFTKRNIFKNNIEH